jgi:flagellar basal-body rod protein FlgB
MTDKLDGVLGFHAEALKLRARRQELLAANLANGDTPHYKAVDFRFADALRAATGATAPAAPAAATPLQCTQPGHLASAAQAVAGAEVLYRTPSQPSVDVNTVDMDVERAQIADNSVRYEAALAFLNHQIKTLLAASQG